LISSKRAHRQIIEAKKSKTPYTADQVWYHIHSQMIQQV